MNIVLAILLVLTSIALIVFVLFQSGGKSSKLSQAIAGGSSENYTGKNKQRAKDKKYSNITTGLAIGFAVLLLAVSIFVNYQVKHPETPDDTTASEVTTAVNENTSPVTDAETIAETAADTTAAN